MRHTAFCGQYNRDYAALHTNAANLLVA